MTYRERIQKLADENGGMFRTTDLTALGYNAYGIRKLVDEQVIERIKQSYYRPYEDEADISEAKQIAQLFPDGVLCMYTALFYYYYYTDGRIPGAVKMAGVWLIPKDAEKPIDRRRKKCGDECDKNCDL